MTNGQKAALTALGVIVPAVFNYLSARADSNEAKVHAEVAYVTLRENVVALNDEVKQLRIQSAECRARTEVMEDLYRQLRSPAKTLLPAAAPRPKADGDGIPDLPAPPDFQQAVQSFKAKR